MSDFVVNSKIHNYQVFFKEDLSFIAELVYLKDRVFVIDKNVFELYQEHFSNISRTDLFLLSATEENKTLRTVEDVCRFVAKKEQKRNITMISIGGGVIQDVTGFAASTLYRGIKWVFIPTTLLAQADSCIGSKTSLNFERYKNIIGGFYPPHEIYIVTEFLKTLSIMDYASGVGEVIKFALLEENGDKDFASLAKVIDDLRGHHQILATINRTLQTKSLYIKLDEFDMGKRNLFNYGHCFGHALENSSDYAVPHGIAVTVGMIFANIVAMNRHSLSLDVFRFLNEKLFLPNIPMVLRQSYFNRDLLLTAMKNDKKRVGELLTIVVPSHDSISAIKVDDLTVAEFDSALAGLLVVLRLNQ